MFVPTWFVPLENTRMGRRDGAKLVEMTDLQWEFFFTCWKYNVECWHHGNVKFLSRYKFAAGVPLYYSMLGRRLFGRGIKYPLWRFAGAPERLLRKRLYLDFTGRRRDPAGMKPFGREIVPGFETVRGLDMIDAAPVRLKREPGPSVSPAAGD